MNTKAVTTRRPVPSIPPGALATESAPAVEGEGDGGDGGIVTDGRLVSIVGNVVESVGEVVNKLLVLPLLVVIVGKRLLGKLLVSVLHGNPFCQHFAPLQGSNRTH